jgi:2-polyprenyl-6-methoxyphenol hydroxylase-like FAD-dependent oxidoreductase
MSERTGSEGTVLVVGAGPTGLTMASELARHGVPCRIVDGLPKPAAESRALGIQSRTLEVFEDMGILQKTLARGLVVHDMNVYSGGKRLIRITMDELDAPYPFVLTLPQSETERLLNEHLRSLGVRVERPVELVDFTQSDDAVTATLRRADRREETFVTPWLLGCDGARSAVRRGLDMVFEGEEYPEAWMLADVKIRWSLPDDEVHLFLHAGGILAVFPMRGQRYRVAADCPGCPPDELSPPTLEEVQACVDERGPGQATLRDAVWLSRFRLHRRKAAAHRQGRAFLAGDAAHIHSPAGGQGMNTGIQDAYNLAWKLALVTAGHSAPSLLDTYHDERERVAEGVLKETDLMTRMNTLRSPVAQELRNHLLALLGHNEVLLQRAAQRMSEIDINYRRSPIVGERHAGFLGGLRPGHSGAGGPRAGDRAPDVRPLRRADGSSARLFDLLRGTKHTLLLLAGVGADAATWKRLEDIAANVRDGYGDLIQIYLVAAGEMLGGATANAELIEDPEQALHHRYAAGIDCVYLVRPDGYVGFRSYPADAAGLKEHLRQVFVPAS